MAGIFTIPPHRPFLDTLVDGLLSAGTERVADTLLLLPSRRACLLARDAFLRASGGRPLLLPRLQPVGEADIEELLLSGELALELPGPIDRLRRQLLLTRLIVASGRTHEQAVRLAGELAVFLDELATEGVSLREVASLAPDELAVHWQVTAEFLQLVQRSWPDLLAAEGRLDPAEHRSLILDAVSRRWQREPPRGPVVAAGSSGSIPAVARLLATVARLPAGMVVLPGLDRGLDEASWESLPPSHPQYMLRRLLALAGVQREAVADWPGEAAAPASRASAPVERAVLWREVMRPAATSGHRRLTAELTPEAAVGVEIDQHRDLAAEATTIALRLRAALETAGKTAALVTPDRNLARRVASELRRWNIDVDDSAGIPLDQSPPGSFLLLTAHLVVEAAAPPVLLAALKHPLTQGGMELGAFRRNVRAIERMLLRGPRPTPGLDGLLRTLIARRAELDAPLYAGQDPADRPRDVSRAARRWAAPLPATELQTWLERLVAMAAPFTQLVADGAAPLAAIVDAHLGFAEALAAGSSGEATELWDREAGREAHAFVTRLRAAADALEAVPANAYPALLSVLMGQIQVRPQRPRHPRLAILGQIESRLADADLVILGGLSEGVWPAAVDTGPWLNRRMRAAIGLPAVEQRVGIAAHDFVSAAMAPELVLSRARKDASGAPATPSRWLQRLSAVVKAAGLAERTRPDPCWAAWANELDRGDRPPRPCLSPRPRPPIAARPRRLSATDIEQLLRNPYGLYARRILGLKALDDLDAEPGGAERGELIHEALHKFVAAYPVTLPAQPLAELCALGRQLFGRFAHEPQVMAVWWPRFVRIATWFVEREQGRRSEVARIAAEVEGSLVLALPGGPFSLQARADRIEVGRDGGLALVDYKTGVLPKVEDVQRGLSPQLPIEALIAAEGGFAELPGGEAVALVYWQLQGGDPVGIERAAGGNAAGPAELIATARAGLERLLAHFDEPTAAYVAVPRPEIAPAFDDYEHLARVAEWRGWGSGG